MIKLRYVILMVVIALGYFFGTILNMGLDKAFSLSESEQQIYTTPNMPDYSPNQDFQQERPFGAMVRLEDKNGEFFCSGTVISDDYVLTAAHCLMNHGLRAGMTKDKIYIKAQGQDLPDIGYAAALNQRADYALIKGNFTLHHRAQIMLTPSGILQINPFEVVSCGYPWGAKDTCYRARDLTPYYTSIAARGLMFPGMSGGPVLDATTGMVFAVNTEVAGDIVIFAPLVGLFETLKVKVVE